MLPGMAGCKNIIFRCFICFRDAIVFKYFDVNIFQNRVFVFIHFNIFVLFVMRLQTLSCDSLTC